MIKLRIELCGLTIYPLRIDCSRCLQPRGRFTFGACSSILATKIKSCHRCRLLTFAIEKTLTRVTLFVTRRGATVALCHRGAMCLLRRRARHSRSRSCSVMLIWRKWTTFEPVFQRPSRNGMRDRLCLTRTFEVGVLLLFYLFNWRF